MVAGSNHLLFELTESFEQLRVALYPWMAITTAILGWCVGRYLSPVWLRWIVLAWCLVLLDCLTILASFEHGLEQEFGYVLVSSQIGLLVLWAILGPPPWQSRLPSVAAATPMLIIFSGSFVTSSYREEAWNILMLVAAVVIALLCGGLRYLGFLLRQPTQIALDATGRRPTYQFGLKHMLIWLTVAGPLLLFVRSLDFKGSTAFPVALVAVSVATVNLIAIWTVLGAGYWVLRIVALVGVPYSIAQGMAQYSAYLNTIGSGSSRRQYGTIPWILANMENLWLTWLWLNALLLAALLVFLRASGYRLMRSEATSSP
jgi:hypothetical protein